MSDTAASSRSNSQSALRRLTSSIGWSGVTQGLVISESLLFVPLFLRTWGPATYGWWLTLTAAASYLTLLDLGGQNHIGNVLTFASARGNLDDFKDRLSEALSFFVVLGASGLVLLGAGSLVLQLFEHGLRGESRIPAGSSWVLFCVGARVLISLSMGMVAASYRAVGHFPRVSAIDLAFRVVELGTGAAIILAGAGPAAYATVLLGFASARAAFIYFDSRRVVPGMRQVRLSLAAAKSARVHLRKSALFLAAAISNVLNQQGTILVTSAMLGVVAVGLLGTHRTAAGLVRYSYTLVATPLWLEMSRLWATQRLDELEILTRVATRVVVLLTSVTAFAALVALPLAYPLWTGRQFTLDSTLLTILLVQNVIGVGWATASLALFAASNLKVAVLLSVMNGALTVVASAAFAPLYGIRGVALASLGADLIFGLGATCWVAARFLGTSPIRLHVAVLGPGLYGAALIGGEGLLARGPLDATTIAWMITLLVVWSIGAVPYGLGREGVGLLGARLRNPLGARLRSWSHAR
jgi:O-antigen/teichoic acid export membrane protein